MRRLPLRARKLIGTLVLLTFLVLYSLLVMTIGVSGHLPEHGAAQFFFYLIAGTIWAFPARYLMIWMLRPDEPS
ncbi:MAG: DUF2842 domain-containing protein [Parvibaculum sp.]|jgi:hypothetical protein|uniref:DUF2842 domain-containing protein n=1 Tax=Parvibaculum sp. TaxID=2024848 RepID=UPI000DCCC8D5|nr:DUF2842 domain-containing protein [Parvibaculum sp.]MDR3500376.1 DUF2842 domain-containing protein [Parvibaculum sp.]RAW03573.1 DUF2842 domain-containing protein [Aerococcus urinae]